MVFIAKVVQLTRRTDSWIEKWISILIYIYRLNEKRIQLRPQRKGKRPVLEKGPGFYIFWPLNVTNWNADLRNGVPGTTIINFSVNKKSYNLICEANLYYENSCKFQAQKLNYNTELIKLRVTLTVSQFQKIIFLS